MSTDISSLLQPEEKVFWQGVISRKVLNVLVVILFVAVLVLAWVLSVSPVSYTSGDQTKYVSGALVGSIVVIVGIAAALWWYFQQIVTEYVVTTKRVLIKSGLIGTDFRSIYFEQMQEVLADVDLIGKVFGVGTVKIDTGKTETSSTSNAYGNNAQMRGQSIKTKVMYTNLLFIDTPYEVYKFLNEALSGRKESLYSGRADQEHLQQAGE